MNLMIGVPFDETICMKKCFFLIIFTSKSKQNVLSCLMICLISSINRTVVSLIKKKTNGGQGNQVHNKELPVV